MYILFDVNFHNHATCNKLFTPRQDEGIMFVKFAVWNLTSISFLFLYCQYILAFELICCFVYVIYIYFYMIEIQFNNICKFVNIFSFIYKIEFVK